MPQRQRLSLHIPGSPPGALPESTTYTPTSDRRRSLISLPDSLSLNSLSSLGKNNLNNLSNFKPTRAKLQKYWPGGRSPSVQGVAKDFTTTAHDLSTLIMLAGEQMGALVDPRRKAAATSRPVSSQPDDPKLQQDLELSLPKSATALSRQSSSGIQRKPVPTNATTHYDASAAVPAPHRAPPPPPIPELSAVNYHSEDVEVAELESPSSPVMPATPVFPSTVRRRAKTPVHHIGQLEAAQRKRDKARQNGNTEGINRMSSVSTIAREYRELAVYPENDIPEVPKIDPSYLLEQGIIELPATPENSLLGASYPKHRTSASMSDDGTLLGSEPDTSFGTCPSLTHSSSPPAELSDTEEEPPALASLRFQIGLELLTKELSTAFADQSSRRPSDAGSSAGLQIWVMIEAYERLREQLDAKPTEENKQARDAIDSWISALYTIHSKIASDGAANDSEYESD